MLEIRGKASLNCATVGNMTVWRGRAFQCVTEVVFEVVIKLYAKGWLCLESLLICGTR